MRRSKTYTSILILFYINNNGVEKAQCYHSPKTQLATALNGKTRQEAIVHFDQLICIMLSGNASVMIERGGGKNEGKF